MSLRVVLRRVAEREFDEAIGCYEAQQVGLGQAFRAVIEQRLRQIAERPEAFPRVRGIVRRAVVLRPFPFVIHFIIETERIVILSVFHTSRNPSNLIHRYPSSGT